MYARHYTRCFTRSLLFNQVLLTLYLSRNQNPERSQDLPKVTQQDVAEPGAKSCSVSVQIPCSVSCDTFMEMVYQLCIISVTPVCTCSWEQILHLLLLSEGKKKIEIGKRVKFR